MNIINVTSRRFLSQQRNGEDYLTNPTTDFAGFYQANAIEKTKLITVVEVSTIFEANSLEEVYAETVGSQIKLVHPFDSWINQGFGENNAIRIENSNTAAFTNETVENVNGNEMFITDTGFFAALGTTDGDSSPYYTIKVTTVPTALTYKFNTIPNGSNSIQFNSILNGEEQAYSANGIGGTLTDLNYLSSQASDRATVQAKYDGSSGTGSYIHTFTVEVVFQNIFYFQSLGVAYQLGTIPQPYQGTNSYKYISEFNFSTNVNDPNQGKIFVDDFLNGSVGLYNQNFNAGTNYYSLVSIDYEVGGFPSDGVDVDEITSVTIQVQKNNGNFSAGELASLYVAKLADSSEYTDQSNSFIENFILSSAFNTSGAAAVDSDFIKNYELLVNAGDNSLLDITFDLLYSSDQIDLVENGDLFFIGVGLEDRSISNYLSDRVVVWCDTGNFIKTTDETGLISKNQINFYNSQQSAATSTPSSNLDTWVNTIHLASGSFELGKFSDGQQTKLKNFKIQIVAWDGTDFFEIQSYTYQIPSGGFGITFSGAEFQQINLDLDNTLGIPTDDEFNRAILFSTVPGSYQAFQRFDWSVGFELGWRTWEELLSVQDVAPIFYDSNEPFNNFNKRMSNYSNLNGFDIYCFATAEIETLNGSTIYQMYSDSGNVYDFDVDAVAGWTATTQFFDEDGNETDNIFIGQDITVVVTMDNPGVLTPLADTGAEIVVEVSGSVNRDYRLHSHKDWSEDANFLEGLSGGNYVDHTQTAAPNKEILKCVLKKEKISFGNKYNFYGHLNWDV